MATLGAIILLTTFVVCIYAAAASIAGARRGSGRLIDSGVGALYLTTALMTVASGIIVHAFVVGDYSTVRSCSGCSCCRCSARSPSRRTVNATVS
jgi:cytochrome c biogenesis factor